LAQFLGDIAFLLELALVAGGLVLLHAARERSEAGLLASPRGLPDTRVGYTFGREPGSPPVATQEDVSRGRGGGAIGSAGAVLVSGVCESEFYS
jgi:hypothetical protein